MRLPVLIIGNKNYSSWSLRPWLVLKAFDLPFHEIKLRLSQKPESNFKRTLAGASRDDIAEFMSVAGLPARGVLTPFLKSYLKREDKLQANAKADPARCTQALNCLTVCGLRDGLAKVGQFCIDLKLAAAFRGEVSKGLFFRGADPLPFGDAIRSASETIHYFLTGEKPLDLQPA